jgi:Cu/Ag efflux pump CusA
VSIRVTWSLIIGGILSSTTLTLVILPALYALVHRGPTELG